MDQENQYLDFQQTETELTAYAGFWERFGAALLDGLILAIPTYAIQFAFILPMMKGGIDPSGDPMEMMGLMGKLYGLGFVLWLLQGLYFAYFESGEKQATWGKQALGIRVVGMNGERISFGRAYGRFAGKIVSSLTCLIGYLMQPFSAKKQALHDMIASTLVLKA